MSTSLLQFSEQWETNRKDRYEAKQTELSLKDTLLTDGYIRNIQNNELPNKLIPASINLLCLQYLHVGLPEMKETKRLLGTRRVFKEYRDIEQDAPDNCTASPTEYDLFEWSAQIIGPTDSCYDGGVFLLSVRFPDEYPFKPPNIKFVTKIYHCNVDDEGVICLGVLQEGWWSPAMTVGYVLMRIYDLMQEAEVEDWVLVPEIAKLYKTNKEEHDRIAKEWVAKYAQQKRVACRT